jgi:hypothetical protein
VSTAQLYTVGVERLICAILIGLLTYDGNLLIITPRARSAAGHGDPDRRQQSR